jgi:aminobenzoyl-glutamate utilization protein B
VGKPGTKDQKYIPFVTKDDPPATHVSERVMIQYRDRMRKYYYDPSRYRTYLEQLGIAYPTMRGRVSGAR